MVFLVILAVQEIEKSGNHLFGANRVSSHVLELDLAGSAGTRLLCVYSAFPVLMEVM